MAVRIWPVKFRHVVISCDRDDRTCEFSRLCSVYAPWYPFNPVTRELEANLYIQFCTLKIVGIISSVCIIQPQRTLPNGCGTNIKAVCTGYACLDSQTIRHQICVCQHRLCPIREPHHCPYMKYPVLYNSPSVIHTCPYHVITSV